MSIQIHFLDNNRKPSSSNKKGKKHVGLARPWWDVLSGDVNTTTTTSTTSKPMTTTERVKSITTMQPVVTIKITTTTTPQPLNSSSNFNQSSVKPIVTSTTRFPKQIDVQTIVSDGSTTSKPTTSSIIFNPSNFINKTSTTTKIPTTAKPLPIVTTKKATTTSTTTKTPITTTTKKSTTTTTTRKPTTTTKRVQIKPLRRTTTTKKPISKTRKPPPQLLVVQPLVKLTTRKPIKPISRTTPKSVDQSPNDNKFLKDTDEILAVVRTNKGGFKGRRLNTKAIFKIMTGMSGNINSKQLNQLKNEETIKVSTDNSYVFPAGQYYFPRPLRVVGFSSP